MNLEIRLDMDGVLCQFVEQSRIAHKIPLDFKEADHWNYFKDWGVSGTEFWKVINEDEFFWEKISPYFWNDDLLNIVSKVDPDYMLLTSPHNHPHCYKGKCSWIQKHLGLNVPERAIFTAKKDDCASPNRVLIDDNDENCEKFIAAGGLAIVFPQKWNSNEFLVNDRLDYIETCLNVLTA